MPKFTSADGLNLHYEDTGTGLPVLALCGLTRNTRDFDYVAPLLPDGVRLIRMDYRGRGQSDWAADFSTYSIPQEGQDALALLDHLGLEKAAILGTSRGGIIGMGLAMAVPDRILGLALNDIGPTIEPKGLEVIMGYLGLPPIWRDLDAAARARSGVMAGFDNVPDTRWREEVDKFYVQTPTGLENRYDPKLRDAVAASMDNLAPDLWPVFDAMRDIPLAAIRGANSDLLSAQTLTEMHQRRPRMRCATIPDRGHVPFLDEPGAVAVLRDWVGELL